MINHRLYKDWLLGQITDIYDIIIDIKTVLRQNLYIVHNVGILDIPDINDLKNNLYNDNGFASFIDKNGIIFKSKIHIDPLFVKTHIESFYNVFISFHNNEVKNVCYGYRLKNYAIIYLYIDFDQSVIDPDKISYKEKPLSFYNHYDDIMYIRCPAFKI